MQQSIHPAPESGPVFQTKGVEAPKLHPGAHSSEFFFLFGRDTGPCWRTLTRTNRSTRTCTRETFLCHTPFACECAQHSIAPDVIDYVQCWQSAARCCRLSLSKTGSQAESGAPAAPAAAVPRRSFLLSFGKRQRPPLSERCFSLCNVSL